MDYIFISSMARSGSTLLDKLLYNHKKLSILSQPFPLLFTKVKKQFHKYIRHPERYYVLNNYFVESRYRPDSFYEYLRKYNISKKFLKQTFDKMSKYSGQLTKIENLNYILSDLNYKSFIQIIKILLDRISDKQNVHFLGSKEIYCEEYLPFLLNNNFKGIIIIRDPRDVITSIYYGKGNEYTGAKYPLLFTIRNWRKSVAFALYMENNPNFMFVRYEDLVNKPYEILNIISDFLGVDHFRKDCFKSGIKDQNDKIWNNNSSFSLEKTISKNSIGRFREKLSNEMIKYIEYTCTPEMKYLNYEIINDKQSVQDLNFQESFPIERERFNTDYSYCKENTYLEMKRKGMVLNCINKKEKKIFFIFERVYEKFKRQI